MTKLFIYFCVSFCILFISHAHAEIYKFVDKNGMVTYTNMPRPGAEPLIIGSIVSENWIQKNDNATLKSIKLIEPPIRAIPISPKTIYKKAAKSVYTLYALEGKNYAQGSGVAIAKKYLLTNYHVIKDADAIVGKNKYGVIKLKVVALSKKYDLAILESNSELIPIEWKKSYSKLAVGENVYLLSSPNGLESTFSDGIISSLRRVDGVRLIQTTTPLSRGSSGGPLFGEFGELIGVATLGSEHGNLNFSVSVDEVDINK